jgi:hypothetical protein
MENKRKRLSLFACLIAYVAGVLSAIYFLAPGKINSADLLDPSKWSQLVDWDQAAEKVEKKAADIEEFYARNNSK